MTKILFLDNDGVICLGQQHGGRFKKQKKWNGRKSSNQMSEIPIEYRFDDFDKGAVKVLNEILEQTGAEIVVSSDWKKHANLQELGDYYESQGIIKRPIDMTKLFHYTNWYAEGFIPKDFPWYRMDSLEQERHFEIKYWLEGHPEITHWVAVDDLNMGIHIKNSTYGPHDREWGLENFVWTPRLFEGIKQTGIKDKIIKYL